MAVVAAGSLGPLVRPTLRTWPWTGRALTTSPRWRGRCHPHHPCSPTLPPWARAWSPRPPKCSSRQSPSTRLSWCVCVFVGVGQHARSGPVDAHTHTQTHTHTHTHTLTHTHTHTHTLSPSPPPDLPTLPWTCAHSAFRGCVCLSHSCFTSTPNPPPSLWSYFSATRPPGRLLHRQRLGSMCTLLTLSLALQVREAGLRV